jgi:hypothetical protein
LVAIIPEPTTMATKRQVPRNSAANFFTASPFLLAIGMTSAYGATPRIFHGADPCKNEQLVNKRKPHRLLLPMGFYFNVLGNG